MEGQEKRSKSVHYGIFEHKTVATLVMLQLPVISQMAMLRAMPHLRQMLQPWSLYRHFTETLLRLISSMLCDPKNADEMARSCLDRMHARGYAPLSGSTILSSLLDNEFVPGDLDYFMRSNDDGSNPSQLLIRDGGPHINYWKTEHKYDFLSRDVLDYICNAYVDDDMKLQMQSVCVKMDPIDFIRSYFDLAFLQNVYDGQTLRVMHPFSVLKRTATLNVARYCVPYEDCAAERWVCRYADYRKRGFTIVPYIPDDYNSFSSNIYTSKKVKAALRENINKSIVDIRFEYAYGVKAWKAEVYDRIVNACNGIGEDDANYHKCGNEGPDTQKDLP